MKAIETLFKEIDEYNAKIKFLNNLYEKYFTLRIEVSLIILIVNTLSDKFIYYLPIFHI